MSKLCLKLCYCFDFDKLYMATDFIHDYSARITDTKLVSVAENAGLCLCWS